MRISIIWLLLGLIIGSYGKHRWGKERIITTEPREKTTTISESHDSDTPDYDSEEHKYSDEEGNESPIDPTLLPTGDINGINELMRAVCPRINFVGAAKTGTIEIQACINSRADKCSLKFTFERGDTFLAFSSSDCDKKISKNSKGGNLKVCNPFTDFAGEVSRIMPPESGESDEGKIYIRNDRVFEQHSEGRSFTINSEVVKVPIPFSTGVGTTDFTSVVIMYGKMVGCVSFGEVEPPFQAASGEDGKPDEEDPHTYPHGKPEMLQKLKESKEEAIDQRSLVTGLAVFTAILIVLLIALAVFLIPKFRNRYTSF